MAVMTSAALDGAVTRISSDMSDYDILAYRSANNRLDGKFRSITVRSLRPGVVVRTRRGYRGASVDDVLSPGTSTAIDSAFGSVAGVSPRANFRIRTAIQRALPSSPRGTGDCPAVKTLPEASTLMAAARTPE